VRLRLCLCLRCVCVCAVSECVCLCVFVLCLCVSVSVYKTGKTPSLLQLAFQATRLNWALSSEHRSCPQLDPPASQILFAKGATLGFVSTHVWTRACSQLGRLLHILATTLDLVCTGLFGVCVCVFVCLFVCVCVCVCVLRVSNGSTSLAHPPSQDLPSGRPGRHRATRCADGVVGRARNAGPRSRAKRSGRHRHGSSSALNAIALLYLFHCTRLDDRVLNGL
jgi:hypothetical protein